MMTYACVEWNCYYQAWVAMIESQDYRSGRNMCDTPYMIPGWAPAVGCNCREDVVDLCAKLGHVLVDTTTHYMHRYDPYIKQTVFTHIERWPAKTPAKP